MKSLLIVALTFITFLLSGCGTPITPEQKSFIRNQTPVYTQVPIWIIKNNIAYGTNYSNGKLIPINTRAWVVAVNDNVIKFRVENKVYLYHIMSRHSRLKTQSMLSRLFATAPVDLSRFSARIRESIQRAEILDGMTKEEVLLARGYPPFHRTKSVESDTWKYWNASRATRTLTFTNNRVNYKVVNNSYIAPKKPVANTSRYQISSASNIRQIYSSRVSKNYNFARTGKINYDSFALVIGINKYAQNTPVEYADLSALAFEELATKTLGVPEANVITILNEKATSGRIKAKIELVKELSESTGNIYLFFAGHGVPGKDGNTYLLPSDMTADAIHLEQNLRLDNIYKKLASSSAKRVFVFMDSCFSGKDDAGGLLYKGVAPVLRTKKLTVQEKKLTVFTAGKSTDFANDNQDKQQRLFSYHLIDELSSGETDLGKIYPRVRSKVKRASLMKGLGYKQEPQIYGKQENKLY